MKDTVVIFGAPDPEQEVAERLCKKEGVPYGYATRDNARVHAGNAYKANGIVVPANQVALENAEVALFECDFEGDVGVKIVQRFDHHRPGDPGYGKPPAQYWEASSLGQIYGWLVGNTPPSFYRMVAAADHFLAVAYRGDCPGVDPVALRRWRLAMRAKFQRRSLSDLEKDVEDAINALQWAQEIFPGVKDLRNSHVPELPEAAAWTGLAFIAKVRDRDGREKIVLQAATPETIREFLAGKIISDLVDIYGDPERGFAGGYLQQK